MGTLTRYNMSVCECEFGPHMELEKTPEGEWVKWEDVETLLYSLLEKSKQEDIKNF